MTETQINSLPRELKELKHWTFWKKFTRENDEVTKPPCNKDGYNHDCTLSKNLLAFDPALKAFLAVKSKGKVAGLNSGTHYFPKTYDHHRADSAQFYTPTAPPGPTQGFTRNLFSGPEHSQPALPPLIEL